MLKILGCQSHDELVPRKAANTQERTADHTQKDCQLMGDLPVMSVMVLRLLIKRCVLTKKIVIKIRSKGTKWDIKMVANKDTSFPLVPLTLLGDSLR